MLKALAESLRPQAFLAFDLPVAPTSLRELPPPAPGAEALEVRGPAGAHLVLLSTIGPLALAFEATLFDLLAEGRYPAPRPKRARGGGLIARLQHAQIAIAAACYPLPAGERLPPERSTVPQLLDLGRLLARLHLLGESHPAQVADPVQGGLLAARLPAGDQADELRDILQASQPPLPLGAVHGRLGPACVLFVGDRVSAVLPSGAACSGPFVLDLAEAIAAWALPLREPMPALRAIVSGYQSLRRLTPEERALLGPVLRYAAARADARWLIGSAGGEGTPCLSAAASLSPDELRAAAG